MPNYIGPYDDQTPAEPADEYWLARRRLAALVRQLNEAVVSVSASEAELVAAADALQAPVEQLVNMATAAGRKAQLFEHEDNTHAIFHENNPLSGLSSAVAPPLNLWFDDDRVYGSVTMGWQYEGPPGCVHGGFVAALFDDFLGMGQKLAPAPGFTANLKTRFIKPTPLNRELRLVGWLASSEGRKNVMAGEMYVGDVLTASCEGLFINMPPDYIANYHNRLQETDGAG